MHLIRQQSWLSPALVVMVTAVLIQSACSQGSHDGWNEPMEGNHPAYNVVQDPNDYNKCPYRCDCFIDSMKRRNLWINCTYDSFGPEKRELLEHELHPDLTTTLVITCSYVSRRPSDITPTSSLWDGAFSKLRGLKELTMDGCILTELQRSSFKGLAGLEQLFIRGANLNRMEMDVFHELPGLVNLELSYSAIRYLPSLCSCEKLRTLNLTGNHMSSLENSGLYCPGGALKSVEVLDVSRNFLTDIPLWLGQNMPQLYRLGIADNYIARATEDSFRHFSNLHLLDMTNNSFSYFSGDLFRHCSNLILLGLSTNDVSHLTPNLLTPLSRLIQLDIADMNLDDGMWDELLDLRLLKSLNISHNQLATINGDVMSRFIRLEYLFASNNKIKSIAKNAFAYQTKLHKIVLSHNEIQSIPRIAFDDQHVLKEFHIDHNNISKVDLSAMAGLKYLTLLDLSHNKIPLLHPTILTDLISLKYLDISSNNMVVMVSNVFDNAVGLEHLNASHNILSSFPFLHKAKSLKVVDISHNNLSSTNIHIHMFKELSQLTFLNLSHNTLSSVPNKLLSDCQSLNIVDFSFNNIKTLGDALFRGLIELKTVDISHNQILDINQVFSETKLLNLDLSYNKLTQILRGNFPQTLQNLNLEGNDISFISAHTFKSMKNIKLVNLQGNKLESVGRIDVEVAFNLGIDPVFLIRDNPFKCDCRLGWLKDWIDGKYESLMDTVPLPNFNVNAHSFDFLCTSPFSSFRKSISRIDRSRFLCNYTDHCDTSCMCCGFDSCYCKYQCPSSCQCYIGDSNMQTHQVRCSLAQLAQVPIGLPEGATDIRLDGNNIHVLHKHAFLAMKHVEFLYINNSQVQSIQNDSFKGLKSVRKLFLHDNFLSTIYDVTFDGLDHVEEIHLENNDIFYIDSNAFLTPPSLIKIDLHGNALMTTSIKDLDRFINRSAALESNKPKMWLSRNPWTCDAEFSCKFLHFILTNSPYIEDFRSIECAKPVMVDSLLPEDDTEPGRLVLDLQKDICIENTTRVDNNMTTYQNATSFNRVPTQSEMYALIATCIIVAFLIVLIVIAYVNRRLLQIFCFTRFGFRTFKMAEDEDDKDRPYDAFISYSNKDEDFVVRQLAPRLEKGDKKYRLCVHYRDFPVGASIAETIVRSVEASKRTIMVVSDNFLESEWCRFEFQTAHQQVLSERRNRVILILMSNLDVNNLDNTLKAYMRTKTYLKYDDAWFWEKLLFAMPNIRTNNNRKMNSESIHMNRPPSNRDLEYIARSPRLALNSPIPYPHPHPHQQHPHPHPHSHPHAHPIARQHSLPHPHPQHHYPPYMLNGNYPHSCCGEIMRNDMYEIPVTETPSESYRDHYQYQLAKVGSISPHTNSAFHSTENNCNCSDSTSGYHNGSIGGSSLPHYEEVGPLGGQVSINSTPQKKHIIETPPPLPRLPKDGFVPRDKMTFV